MKKIFWITILLIFGFAACNPQAQSTATRIPSPIVIPSSTLPFTSTAEAIDTPTVNPPTPDGTATENARWESNTTEFPDCPLGPPSPERKKSPDGQWTASVCEYFLDDDAPINHYRLQIRKKDGSKEWKVFFKDMTGFEYIWFTNRFGEHNHFISIPFPFHWYKDSRYLFIAPRVLIDGDRSSGLGLYRFDTQTGRLSPFLPAGESTYDFAFSPDDEYYVYQYGMEEKNIHIVSLENDKNQTFQLPDETGYVGNFIWSPDSSKFVFESYKRTTKKSALLLFDTTQQTFTSLIEIDDEYGYNLDLIEWVSNSQVKIWKEQSQYLLNIETKELQPIPTEQVP